MKNFAVIFLLALSPLIQQKTPSLGNQFIGSWHGTSICVDRKTDTACKDEEVVYVVKRIPSVRDTVEMEAFKIINSERVSMGTLNLQFSRSTDMWTFELAARAHALWAFQVKDSTITGTLLEMPSKRLIRQVQANRVHQ